LANDNVSLVILIEDFEMNENRLNAGRIGYQPIRTQTKRIGELGPSTPQK